MANFSKNDIFDNLHFFNNDYKNFQAHDLNPTPSQIQSSTPNKNVLSFLLLSPIKGAYTQTILFIGSCYMDQVFYQFIFTI